MCKKKTKNRGMDKTGNKGNSLSCLFVVQLVSITENFIYGSPQDMGTNSSKAKSPRSISSKSPRDVVEEASVNGEKVLAPQLISNARLIHLNATVNQLLQEYLTYGALGTHSFAAKIFVIII